MPQLTITNIIIALVTLYVVMSIASYLSLRIDKRRSERNARRLKDVPRIPERTLHFLEAVGGWPGSLVAQRSLRHKNQKRPYQTVFWIIVAIHLLLWGIGAGVVIF